MNLDIGKPFVGRQAPEQSGVDVRRHHVLGQTADTEAGDDQSARKSSKRSEKKPADDQQPHFANHFIGRLFQHAADLGHLPVDFPGRSQGKSDPAKKPHA
nr:hypothetical protein [Pseudomonas sp. FW305-70]